jgi:hypothetical protein
VFSGVQDSPLGCRAPARCVGELEGTTQREARAAWANREGLHGGPTRSRLTDAKRPEITTALYTAPRPATRRDPGPCCAHCGHHACHVPLSRHAAIRCDPL